MYYVICFVQFDLDRHKAKTLYERAKMAFNVNFCLQRIAELEENLRRMEEELFWGRIERQQRENELLNIRWRQMVGADNDDDDANSDTQASDYDSDDTYDSEDSAIDWLCTCEKCPKMAKLDE